ncbi:AAA family ATPase [Gillisia limnaea]|uniref:Adenylate/guanylate cyclase with GAF sensor(S) n=1 Tax=Gillisia limnaea (strain DSM 15749 / LMG 21470 / R-8282) TaxID=865937 RepID=H2BSZ0_GILLR|nr:AAA family ATPase [Gillisia limnaea]EHQ01520.1 adenylate/guanylate cyclase with GAF sensor(s) [Gillisia limnaea DSM 15749]
MENAIRTSIFIPGYVLEGLIIESPSHTIYKAKRKEDGCGVIIKTLQHKFPSREDLASLQREYRIASSLNFEEALHIYALERVENGNLAIVMEDFGISLVEYSRSFIKGVMPVGVFLSIAAPLVKTLGKIHEFKVIHKEIVPGNILIDPHTQKTRIIDFGSSSELLREFQTSILSDKFEGSLAYMSPEQTGRINRNIDYRTDYYSLGIVFYELLTGTLPFQGEDALEWVHNHISKQPKPPNALNPNIPAVLSKIVMKLLAKNAEDRYQSSFGIITDLEICKAKFSGGLFNFDLELGKYDVSPQFQIPQKLYGREKELEKLISHFEKVVLGSVEFCLVTGYSGVGKSVLVQELGRLIAQKKGYFIQGKFEQFRQNDAYMALANAFRSLIKQILGESGKRLQRWKEGLLSSLGNNGQLMVDLVPELELIIGKQEPLPNLPPAEAQNRFLLIFTAFLKVFAKEEHPLVIFLDDLQWSDVPTLNLINKFIVSQDLNHLLLIGAYRDNEVDIKHPLHLTIGEIEKYRYVETINLEPLKKVALTRIIKDTLLCNKENAKELGYVLFEKTRGNPFFTIELLKNLNEREIISFNSDEGFWDWDITKVKAVDYSNNVIDFLLSSFKELSPATQHLLEMAACIGAYFDLKTLSIIMEQSMETIALELYEALKLNIIIPLDDSYKFIGIDSLSDDISKKELDPERLNPTYKFQHDRLQQVAYSLISIDKRQAVHLSIGRLILKHQGKEEMDERLMEIVGHLNAGRILLKDPVEKTSLAELNLQAGIKAKRSTAYEASLEYLRIGYELLHDTGWQKDFDLCWKLSEEIQHCFYLTGDWENADNWTNMLLENARSDLQKGTVYSARTRQYATIGRMKESIVAAYEGLSVLGFNFLSTPNEENTAEEVNFIKEQLHGREISSLLDLPLMSDEKAKIASQLIMEIFPAAFLSGSGVMFPYLVLKSVNIALEFGNSPESAFSYAGYGMILCGYFNDPATGFQYGKLGVELIDRFHDISLKSRIIYVYTMFVHHWSNHWSSMTSWFRKGIEAGYQSGDLLYLAYSAQDCIIWDPTLDLETASREHRKLLLIVKECDYQDSYDSGTLFLQMQLNFQGLTNSLFSLSNDDFDEIYCLEGMNSRKFMTGISNFNIYKAEIYLLYNKPEGAYKYVLDQDKMLASVMALPQLVRFQIVSFLVRSSIFKITSEENRELLMTKMKESLTAITLWARQCEANFEHLRLLMEAELAGISGELNTALKYYESSITMAKKHQFIRDEAMANERTALLLIDLGIPKAAEGYLQSAHYLYYRWGAHRKVSQLLEDHLGILNPAISVPVKNILNRPGIPALITNSFSLEQIDMNSVFKASQIISGELVLEKLLTATLEILIENSGAQKGFLIEQKEGKIAVLAKIDLDQQKKSQKITNTPLDHIQNLPLTLINTSFRTNQTIGLDNASEINSYSSDPYINSAKPLSVLCVPLPSRAGQKLAVYLENNLTRSVFTEERVQIIKLLTGQAGISIENAKIYESQKKLLKAQQRFVPIQFLRNLGHDDIAKVKLGESVLMEMSVLFSDLRDFTPLVEQLSPQKVIELLNKYFSTIGVSISASGGFIDSYAGDEVMALFAVPPQQAVMAGIKMVQALRIFNQNSGLHLKMGIGMNTGPLVLGTMGGADRMQCTVLGDTVNLASRIEQLTKLYKAQFLIGEDTYNGLDMKQAFSLRQIDRVAVKGKGKAVSLYEVLDAESDNKRAKKEASSGELEEGMQAYYNRDFRQAYEIFNAGIQKNPDDPVFSIFAKRTKIHMIIPPDKDWQGFEQLTSK